MPEIFSQNPEYKSLPLEERLEIGEELINKLSPEEKRKLIIKTKAGTLGSKNADNIFKTVISISATAIGFNEITDYGIINNILAYGGSLFTIYSTSKTIVDLTKTYLFFQIRETN